MTDGLLAKMKRMQQIEKQRDQSTRPRELANFNRHIDLAIIAHMNWFARWSLYDWRQRFFLRSNNPFR